MKENQRREEEEEAEISASEVFQEKAAKSIRNCYRTKDWQKVEQWIKSFWTRLTALAGRSDEDRKKRRNVSFGVTDKVSAARCCLYQLFPHCVWLLRRWAAQRCPPGLERRRTGRGAWRDKNLISLQPFVASPSIPSSSHPRRTTVWYYRYAAVKRTEQLLHFSAACLMMEESFVYVLAWRPAVMLSGFTTARWRFLSVLSFCSTFASVNLCWFCMQVHESTSLILIGGCAKVTNHIVHMVVDTKYK